MRAVVLYILCFAGGSIWGQMTFERLRPMMHAEKYGACLSLTDSCIVKNYQKDSALYYKTLILLKQQRVRDASKTWKELVKLYPEFSEAYYLGGLIYFSQEDYAKSADEFNRMLRRNPTHLRALYNRSVALGILEDYLPAIEDLSACIKIDPENSLYYYARAYWYEYTGNYAECEKDYLRSIQLDPKNYDSYYGLAFIYDAQKEPGKACDIINQAIQYGSQIAVELKNNFCH